MRFNEIQLPVIENGKSKQSQHIGDIFQQLQKTGFKYLSLRMADVDDDTPDDEVIEAYREQIEELMSEDNYENIEVIRLKNYSPSTGAYVYKPLRDKLETRLITHGQCSLFVEINEQTFEFQCRQGDMIRLPAEICYWLEVGVHACRYIHLHMTEAGWDRPADKQDIQPCTLSRSRRQAS